MAYDVRLTIYIPESMIGLARAISRAMDPDIGGEFSFPWIIAGEAVYSTLCVPEFADAMDEFKLSPELFYNSVCRDYSLRWPELTPPTQEEITAFCNAVRLERGEWSPPAEIIGGDNVWI